MQFMRYDKELLETRELFVQSGPVGYTTATDMKSETIRDAYKDFMKKHPDGQISSSELERIYEGKNKNFCRAILKVMDADGNGVVDFKEFIVCSGVLDSIISHKVPNDKSLRWLFRSLDVDNSGTITMKEFLSMSDFLSTIERGDETDDKKKQWKITKLVQGIDERITGLAVDLSARALFNDIDINAKMLTEEEFVKGMKEFFENLYNSQSG